LRRSKTVLGNKGIYFDYIAFLSEVEAKGRKKRLVRSLNGVKERKKSGRWARKNKDSRAHLLFR